MTTCTSTLKYQVWLVVWKYSVDDPFTAHEIKLHLMGHYDLPISSSTLGKILRQFTTSGSIAKIKRGTYVRRKGMM